MTPEDRLRMWPRERIKPQAVARGLDVLLSELDAQAREIASLRAALEFYAEIREYNRIGGDPMGTPSPIMHDKGARARSALAAAPAAATPAAEPQGVGETE